MEQVRVLRQKGAYADAEKAALAAVAEVEKSGYQDADLAKTWNNLGSCITTPGGTPKPKWNCGGLASFGKNWLLPGNLKPRRVSITWPSST
jgi:hypothetical protein